MQASFCEEVDGQRVHIFEGHDAIFACIDKLSKMIHFMPTWLKELLNDLGIMFISFMDFLKICMY